jgi:hypothetical protein
MKTFKSFIAAMAVLLLLGFADLSVAVRRVVVRVAPPAPKVVVVQKKCPYKNGVWVAGRWEWRKNNHVWSDGYWVKARHGFVWVDGHWAQTPDGWEWIEGHWKKL